MVTPLRVNVNVIDLSPPNPEGSTVMVSPLLKSVDGSSTVFGLAVEIAFTLTESAISVPLGVK